MSSGRKKVLLAGLGLAALGVLLVPSLLRMRVQSGEHPTLGDARAIASAQQAWASTNGGLYAPSLGCLARPASCRPGDDGPVFLDAFLAEATSKSGHLRRFVPGPVASPDEVARVGAVPGSLVCWAWVATPISPETARWSFCVDCSGAVCGRPDGHAPVVRPDGTCSACQPFR